MSVQMHNKSAHYFSDPGALIFRAGALLLRTGSTIFFERERYFCEPGAPPTLANSTASGIHGMY
jgi:hypothetical protein